MPGYKKSAIAKYRLTDIRPPPKAAADLFEAFVGAVFVQFGFDVVKSWLQTIFRPLIEAANQDYTSQYGSGSLSVFVPKKPAPQLPWGCEIPETTAQLVIGDFIRDNHRWFVEGGEKARAVLPSKESGFRFIFDKGVLLPPSGDRIELGSRLMELWICEICTKEFPEYYLATGKAPGLFTVSYTLQG